MSIRSRRFVLGTAPAVLAALALAGTALAKGPSTSVERYVVPTMKGVVVTPILTVGDSVDGYEMVGIPDGLGAYDNGDGTFTLLMNHELSSGDGVVRAHGSKGAFVSKWTIKKGNLEVRKGEDLILDVGVWTGATWDFSGTTAFNRFCSADLPEASAFYNGASGKGFDGRLFLNGEEASEGRAFAHGLDGTSWQLPRLGRFAYENSLANAGTGDATVVVSTDDSSPLGQVYVYVGAKQTTGNPVEKAGLANGTLYGIKVHGYAVEPATGIPSGTTFTLVSLGDVSGLTAAQLDAASDAAGVTEFLRPEDGHWDPENTDDFYFVTTATFTTNSRLWRLNFTDASNPTAGGTIDMLLDGSEGQKMLDNMCVTDRGQAFLQEDPGNQAYLAKIWRYDLGSGALVEIATHNADLFLVGEPGFLTQDEESSGIIDVSSILGEGKFLLDVQAHYSLGGELVQGGQLLLMSVPPGKK